MAATARHDAHLAGFAPAARALAIVGKELEITPAFVGKVVRRYNEELSRARSRDLAQPPASIARAAADERRANGPTAQRRKHLGADSAIDAGEAFDDTRGRRRVKTHSIREPIDVYRRRGEITARQKEAADLFRNAFDLGVHGAQDPDTRDPGMPRSGRVRTTLAEAHIWALETCAAVRKRLGATYGLIESVVCYSMSIGEIAESRIAPDLIPSEIAAAKRTQKEQLRWQLRFGLDALGDAMLLAPEVVREQVKLTEDLLVTIEYRPEPDGRGVSAVRHSGLAWIEEASSIAELRKKAAKLQAERGKLVEITVDAK